MGDGMRSFVVDRQSVDPSIDLFFKRSSSFNV